MPRSAVGPLVVSVVLIAVAAACTSGEGTPTMTPEATATSAPKVNVPVPTRPDAFADYPEVIVAYLSEAGVEALGPPCLAALLDAWQMPPGDEFALTPAEPPGGERCTLGSTDTDLDDEVTIVLTATPKDEAYSGLLLSNLVVFDLADGGYRVAFESASGENPHLDLFPVGIITVEDVNGDAAGDLVYTVITCGAHTCTWTVHAVTGDGLAYRRLTPEEGIAMTTADVLVEDRDSDGIKEIILHGGTISSVGAGPQRTRTEVYGWNGTIYELIETTLSDSDLLYFHIRDADLLFGEGEYGEALSAYRRALSDESLVESMYYENERAELSAYALFRSAVALLVGGGSEGEALAELDRATSEFSEAINASLAEMFREGYDASADLSAGCLAVRDHVAANVDRFREVWEYGYANPAFDPDALCPF